MEVAFASYYQWHDQEERTPFLTPLLRDLWDSVNRLKEENAALRMDLEAGNRRSDKEAMLMSEIDQLKHALEAEEEFNCSCSHVCDCYFVVCRYSSADYLLGEETHFYAISCPESSFSQVPTRRFLSTPHPSAVAIQPRHAACSSSVRRPALTCCLPLYPVPVVPHLRRAMRIRGGMLSHTAAAAVDAGNEGGQRTRTNASRCGAPGPSSRSGAAAVEAWTPGGARARARAGAVNAEELGCLSDADLASFWALVVEEVARRKSEEGPRSGPPGEKQGLTFELVSRYFSLPIKQAARELNVGLTVLKKRCRELGIPRWPHRKVKSLQTLIDKVQEFGESAAQPDGDLTMSWVERLQRTKKLIEERPEVMLDQETKELRQACFKEAFKRRRLLSHDTYW
ncbi:protein RKD3-like [Panicum miliaceum]|uniref:Protein RKD3-like n=1 Tax=Panicum miliaceum TaxID=4540 RepID=A0A3L6RTC3_PANMI|nr:protein RKD3-like [Panicum miliaceum]